MTDKTQPTAHAEITAPISADLRGIEKKAREVPEPSPTAGMNLGQRILHVGGRENKAGYIEFGSVAAVRALVSQVLRDRHAAQPARECLHLSAESARWYSVSSSGMATLCADEADARATAEDSDMIFPRFAPHTAVQLAPLKAAPAPAQAVAVPEGWKLVPINDTPAMWTAGGRAIKSCGGHERDAASLAYKAMVEAAAPAQAVAVPDETTPEYGSTDLGWSTFPPLADGEKRLMALITNLFGNDHQAFNDLDALVNRARLAPTTPAHKGE